MSAEQLLKLVSEHYLASGDFNGYPLAELLRKTGLDEQALTDLLEQLVRDRRLSLEFGDRHVNPHMLAFEPDSVDSQIDRLHRLPWTHACAYPTSEQQMTTINKGVADPVPRTLG